MSAKKVYIHSLNHLDQLVMRSQLRASRHVKRFRYRGALPPVPAVWDWSSGGACSYPLYGNSRYGDCYMAAVCHHVGTQTICHGAEYLFDEAALEAAYLKLSGGDNGLADSDIFPFWMSGLVGTPHRILDWLVLPLDDETMSAVGYLFGALEFTLGLPAKWISNPHPGQVWDAGPGVYADDSAGHAVHLSAKKSAGYDLQTWGFRPPVCLTPAGVKVCDGEAIAVFSLDWFDASGYAPNGEHYNTLAPLWHQIGGKIMPPNPFNPPSPTPPSPTPPSPTPPTPTPPPPPCPPCSDGLICVDLARQVVLTPPGWLCGTHPPCPPPAQTYSVLGSSKPGLLKYLALDWYKLFEDAASLYVAIRQSDVPALQAAVLGLLCDLGICLTPEGHVALRAKTSVNWVQVLSDLLQLFLDIRKQDIAALEADIVQLLSDLGVQLGHTYR